MLKTFSNDEINNELERTYQTLDQIKKNNCERILNICLERQTDYLGVQQKLVEISNEMASRNLSFYEKDKFKSIRFYSLEDIKKTQNTISIIHEKLKGRKLAVENLLVAIDVLERKFSCEFEYKKCDYDVDHDGLAEMNELVLVLLDDFQDSHGYLVASDLGLINSSPVDRLKGMHRRVRNKMQRIINKTRGEIGRAQRKIKKGMNSIIFFGKISTYHKKAFPSYREKMHAGVACSEFLKESSRQIKDMVNSLQHRGAELFYIEYTNRHDLTSIVDDSDTDQVVVRIKLNCEIPFTIQRKRIEDTCLN